MKDNTIAWDVIGIYDISGAKGLRQSGNKFIDVKERA